MGNAESAIVDETLCPSPVKSVVIHFMEVTGIPQCESKESHVFIRSQMDQISTQASPQSHPVRVVTTLSRSYGPSLFFDSYRNLGIEPSHDARIRIDIVSTPKFDSKEGEVLGTVSLRLKDLSNENKRTEILYNAKDPRGLKYPNFSISFRRVFSNRLAPREKTIFLLRHGNSKWNQAQAKVNIGGMILDRDHALTREGVVEAQSLNERWIEEQSRLQSQIASMEQIDLLDFSNDSSISSQSNANLNQAKPRKTVDMNYVKRILIESHIISADNVDSSDGEGSDDESSEDEDDIDSVKNKSKVDDTNIVTNNQTSVLAQPRTLSSNSQTTSDVDLLDFLSSDTNQSSNSQSNKNNNGYVFDLLGEPLASSGAMNAGNATTSSISSSNNAFNSTIDPFGNVSFAGNSSNVSTANDSFLEDLGFAQSVQIGASNRSQSQPQNNSFGANELHTNTNGIKTKNNHANNSNSSRNNSHMNHNTTSVGAMTTGSTHGGNPAIITAAKVLEDRGLNIEDIIESRKEQLIRMFVTSDAIFSSPLTRAIETAVLALEGHPTLMNKGLKLLNSIREVKKLGGFDTVGIETGKRIKTRVINELTEIIGRTAAEFVHHVAMDVSEAETPWWAPMSSFENSADQQERIADFLDFVRYCDYAHPIFVGHSLFFKAFYSHRVSKMLSRTRPDIALKMKHHRLHNSTLLAITIHFSDKLPTNETLDPVTSSRSHKMNFHNKLSRRKRNYLYLNGAMIIDAEVLFGGGFHGDHNDEESSRVLELSRDAKMHLHRIAGSIEGITQTIGSSVNTDKIKSIFQTQTKNLTSITKKIINNMNNHGNDNK